MIQDKLAGCKALFEPGAHTELRAQENTSKRVSLLSGSMVANAKTVESGVSARVYKNGVYGFASGAEYSDENIAAVLRAATANADFMALRAPAGKPELPYIAGGRYESPLAYSETPQARLVEAAREVDAYVVKHCPELIGRSVSVRENEWEKLLAVGDGCDSRSYLMRSYVYVWLTAATPSGAPVELGIPVGGFGTFETNFASLDKLWGEIDKVYDRLMQKRGGVYPDAGLKTCVLSGDITGILAHEAVGHTVEADLVLGGSVAGPCLNKVVASPLVNLTDYANTYLDGPAPLPVYVDDEGTPATDAVIIRDGVLVGYMNSRESAQHFGMEPNGNARAYAFSDEPLIRMRNTAILPGRDRVEDMIASVEDGYYLIETGNGQADTTGEFMFAITMGYEIKHGRLARPLLDTTISGVAFEMLKTVDMVGSDMKWISSGYCGKKQMMPVGMGGPTLKCRVLIGGR